MISKKYNAQMGNYLAKLAKAQTNIKAEQKPQTNADRIRAMTDEELAEWIWGAESSGRAYGPRGKVAWLDWLKRPVEEKE